MNEIRTLGTWNIPEIGERRLRAYVPSWRADGTRAPLLVLFDGQNVFGDEGSFSGGWYAHEAVEALGAEGISAPIVIGIDHGGASRIDELGPWRCKRGGGKLDALLRFVKDEVLPHAHAELGASRRAEDVTIGGSSMGGLAAVYAHLSMPDVFGRALAMSPSLWFAERRMLSFVESASAPKRGRLYVDAGEKEGIGMVAHARALTDALGRRGYQGDGLRLVVDPDGGHSEACWRKRLPEALRFTLEGVGRARRAA